MALPAEINGWSVESELGSGDFGTVYKVTRAGTVGALKQAAGTGSAASERLRFEQRALDRLRDAPGIPSILDSGATDIGPYLVMSFGKGLPISKGIEHNSGLGRLYGDLETLSVLCHLLESVAAVHSAGLAHRDIKGANVLYDEESGEVTLIDFGFCKEAGTSGMQTDDSFWRVGSARFSPPSKIQNPAFADPSHDVFAVGVLGYLMLTSAYPWSASAQMDISGLRRAHATRPLEPVTELNSYVMPRISHWISRLLELEDRRRPTAQEALEQIRQLGDSLRQSNIRALRTSSRPRYPVVLRDPIHGDIRLTTEEYGILLTPEMQRLRSIRQLGLTNMVYPGAEHSRLSHVVGCVARVEQMLSTIEQRDGIRLDPDLRAASRLFALVHDVTHIPFGHTLEDELGLFARHDENGPRAQRLLFSDGSDLGRNLGKSEVGRAVLPRIVAEDRTAPHPLFVDLVADVTGADVLDYIARDALFCGLDERIDSAIFRQLRLHARSSEDSRIVSIIGGKYGVRFDRSYAVETICQRYACS
jgi:serine/threonine protein kinase